MMGREIRRVPAGWEHPRLRDFDDNGWVRVGRRENPDAYQPMHEKLYTVAADEWLKDCLRWMNREDLDDDEKEHRETHPYYWDWDGPPPDMEYHRHGKWAYTDEEATHYQVYETVTEGTPVSPVFATLEELQAWLISKGHTEAAAERFAKTGHAFSMVIAGGRVVKGIEGALILDP